MLPYPASQARAQLIYSTGMCFVLPACLKDALPYCPLEYLPYSDRPDSRTLVEVNQTACDFGPVCSPRWVCVGHSSSQGGYGFPQVPAGRNLMKGPVLLSCRINASRS